MKMIPVWGDGNPNCSNLTMVQCMHDQILVLYFINMNKYYVSIDKDKMPSYLLYFKLHLIKVLFLYPFPAALVTNVVHPGSDTELQMTLRHLLSCGIYSCCLFCLEKLTHFNIWLIFAQFQCSTQFIITI
jgi:hypothetical protein